MLSALVVPMRATTGGGGGGAGRLSRPASLSTPTKALIFLCTLAPLYYTSYLYRLHHPYPPPRAGPAASGRARPTEADWGGEWLRHDLLGVGSAEGFEIGPLRQFCQTTNRSGGWRADLVLNLDDANGGIGNVRGNLLDFVFYAVEVGASIMLPGMARRGEGDDLANVFASRAQFGDFFDEEWFVRVLGEACPHMAIYKPEPGRVLTTAPLAGKWLPRSRRLDEDAANTRAALLQHLDDWLRAARGDGDGDPGAAVTLVNVERTLWNVDTRTLPYPRLRRSLGGILRIHPRMRRLAALAVQQLNARHAGGAIDPRDPVPARGFYGAHLRTEADADALGWTAGGLSWHNQTSAYLADARDHGLAVVYVASGNASDLARFRDKAARLHPRVTLTSKRDLLPAAARDELDALSWDQQALVDYEVLLRCSRLGGIVKSSFAYNLAITRNQFLADAGTRMEPWRVLHSEAAVAFDDRLSRILGRDPFHEHRIPRGMWP